MLKIGLTGGIGSGKTYVAEVFSKIGIPVYEADIRAKSIMRHSQRVKETLFHLFGKNAYIGSEPNNKYIASKVFNDKSLLDKLNNTIHPAVNEDFEQWCKSTSQARYIIKEAAILFQTDSYKSLDKIIAVSAPINVRIKRAMARDGATEKKIKDRITNQLPTEKINTLADFVVNNDGKSLILPQIIQIDNIIINEWQNLGSGLEQG